jgi:hypothetical protein
MLVWTQCHQKLFEEKFVYGLEVFIGYQKIIGPRGVQTFERGMNKKNKGL